MKIDSIPDEEGPFLDDGIIENGTAPATTSAVATGAGATAETVTANDPAVASEAVPPVDVGRRRSNRLRPPSVRRRDDV